MRRDIDRQPVVLATLQARAGAFMEMGAQVLQPGVGGRLFVTGCGDGLFAAMAAQAFAERLGIDWRPIGALDLVLSAGSLTPADRVLAISIRSSRQETGNTFRSKPKEYPAVQNAIPFGWHHPCEALIQRTFAHGFLISNDGWPVLLMFDRD